MDYSYDGFERMEKETYKTSSATTYEAVYTYDSRSNVINKTSYDPRSHNATYRSESFSYGNANQLVGTLIYDYKGDTVSYTTFSNDVNGNIISRTEKNGANTVTGTASYAYDALNRMSSFTENSSNTTQYTYGTDNRIIKTDKNNVTTHLVSYGGVITYEDDGTSAVAYIVSGSRVEGELTSQKTKHYVYSGIGEISCILTASYSGFANNKISYDAYGNKLSGNEARYGYKGYFTDAGSGLYYLNARWYDASIQQFTQEDPAKDGTNWYTYCAGDPVNRSDPTGLCWGYYDEGNVNNTVWMRIGLNYEQWNSVLSMPGSFADGTSRLKIIDHKNNILEWCPPGCSMVAEHYAARKQFGDAITDYGNRENTFTLSLNVTDEANARRALGISYSLVRDIGFNVQQSILFLSRPFCLLFASSVIALDGNKGFLGIGSNLYGMSATRIAAELFSHAVVYWAAEPFRLAANLIGLDIKFLNDIHIEVGDTNVNNNDTKWLGYYAVWYGASIIKQFIPGNFLLQFVL